ncbi:MAG TPA: class I SAM-dependent methyltransferase [Desulfomonilia bacterium]|nr:class I SAM-dependent methyltransferase [Desulfomonilia bacterium]
MVLFDITSRYNSLEAFLYDYLVAPAVFDTLLPFKDTVFAMMKEGSRILDIGCGGGQLAVELAKAKKGLDVTGVDLSISQLRRAKLRSMKAEVKVDFIRASALGLPLPDESIDLVYSVDSIKHWPDRGRGLRECVRVIKPGGMLFISEVNRDCTLGQGMRFVRNWRMPAVLRPFSVLSFFLFAVLRSLTLDEARALAVPLALDDVSVAPDLAGINWTIKAIKPRRA